VGGGGGVRGHSFSWSGVFGGRGGGGAVGVRGGLKVEGGGGGVLGGGGWGDRGPVSWP